MNYRHFIIIFTFLSWVVASSSLAEQSNQAERLQNLKSWNEISAAAKRDNKPIVLLIEQRHCAFCQRLKRDVFGPLANNPAYFDRVLFASVLTDYDAPTIDKGESKVSGFEFAETWNASTTPTILFLDESSNEIQKRIVGYVATAEYKNRLVAKLERSILTITKEN